ncbi:hypothetical protein LAZ67_3001906 [Cordylochernes scorpioides]|uniref:Mos1 transposase HTH domain-containing protein n=1 Tax=Cordylochernes scorpioides TaxID=51811 RepID=A0ABY6K8U7_9ARAC|nr:hypothetical protein LAZ67_3001906 [Cordylochernes scorpioides]
MTRVSQHGEAKYNSTPGDYVITSRPWEQTIHQLFPDEQRPNDGMFFVCLVDIQMVEEVGIKAWIVLPSRKAITYPVSRMGVLDRLRFYRFKKMGQRTCIKFCVKNEIKCADAFRMLTVAYGEATLDRSNVYRWYKMFSEGQEDVNDEERAGRPSTSTTDEKFNEVEKMILANRRIAVREVAEDLNISIGSCHSIFINDLGMRRVAAKFVPKLLNCDQKQHRMNITNEMLDSVRDDPNLLQRVITGDEAIYTTQSTNTTCSTILHFCLYILTQCQLLDCTARVVGGLHPRTPCTSLSDPSILELPSRATPATGGVRLLRSAPGSSGLALRCRPPSRDNEIDQSLMRSETWVSQCGAAYKTVPGETDIGAAYKTVPGETDIGAAYKTVPGETDIGAAYKTVPGETDIGAVYKTVPGETDIGAAYKTVPGETDIGAAYKTVPGETDIGAAYKTVPGETDIGAAYKTVPGETDIGAVYKTVPGETDIGAAYKTVPGETDIGAAYKTVPGETDIGAVYKTVPGETDIGAAYKTVPGETDIGAAYKTVPGETDIGAVYKTVESRLDMYSVGRNTRGHPRRQGFF